MSRRIVTKDEAESFRTYGSIHVLPDGRVRFHVQAGSVATLAFQVQRHHWEEPDVYVYDSANYGISVEKNGEPLFSLFVHNSRIKSACFNFHLYPATLRQGVRDLLKTASGIEGWLAPGLEVTQSILARGRLGNPALLKAIPAVLRSLEGIPRADRPARTVSKKKAPSRKATPGRRAGRREQAGKR